MILRNLVTKCVVTETKYSVANKAVSALIIISFTIDNKRIYYSFTEMVVLTAVHG